MGRARKHLVIGAAALALVAGTAEGGAQLRLGFENCGDPNPRQMKIGMEVAGLALGLAISWSRSAPSLRAF